MVRRRQAGLPARNTLQGRCRRDRRRDGLGATHCASGAHNHPIGYPPHHDLPSLALKRVIKSVLKNVNFNLKISVNNFYLPYCHFSKSML